MKTLSRTIIAVLAVLACLPAAHAQAPVSVRQMVHQADFVGVIQTEPSASDSQGEWRQNVFVSLSKVESIKGSLAGSLAGDLGSSHSLYIKADHIGVAGYPTHFGDWGEYLVFLHGPGSGLSPRWTTLAAYRVDYHPEGLDGVFRLGADNAVGLLASGTALALPPSPPILTLTEARRWLGRLALGQPLTARDEAKMNSFFHASLLSREASLSRATPSRAERLAVAQKLADAVPLGMTRAQVEKIFPQPDGGLISSGEGRYYFGSEVMIDAPYDASGGPFQPENRVSGPLHVYRDSMHYD